MPDQVNLMRAFILGEQVPGRIADFIERNSDLEKLRIRVRGHDPEVSAALEGIHRSALAWRISATGTPQAPAPETAGRSLWLSTTQAATRLGITDRAVRVATAQGRIPAEKLDGRWRIARIDLENYKAAHRSR